MKLIFFKWKSLLSRLITLFWWAPYSHIWIELNWYYYEAWMVKWILDSKIIKTLHRSTYHSPSTQVDIFEIPWNFDNEWLDRQVGVAYDFKAIIWYVFKKIKQDPNKWYCSELVYKYLVHCWILKYWEKYPSPTRVYELLKEKWELKS